MSKHYTKTRKEKNNNLFDVSIWTCLFYVKTSYIYTKLSWNVQKKCEEERDPCDPNPCGEGALCLVQVKGFIKWGAYWISGVRWISNGCWKIGVHWVREAHWINGVHWMRCVYCFNICFGTRRLERCLLIRIESL